MKRSIPVLLMLFAGSTLGAESKTALELTAIAQELANAIGPGDKAVFDRWLAEDFILVDRDGSI